MASGYRESYISDSEQSSSEELDGLRAMLAFILMDSTDMELDSIYSLLFRDGSRITWH